MVRRMKAVQIAAAGIGSSQPISMARRAAGAESERRRLSSSFQRPISGIGVFGEPSLALSPKAEDPGQQLPVAAHPAMLARRRDVVARGKFLDHLDVGGQAGAREDAFQQIVAENRVFRNLAFERGLEDVDVVDSLAAIGAFLEQVLIDVGNRERIGIEPVGAGKDALKQRTFAADRQRRRHARLQDAVALHDQAGIADRSRGRLSGCAILPTRRLAAPIGRRVSASSVMT